MTLFDKKHFWLNWFTGLHCMLFLILPVGLASSPTDSISVEGVPGFWPKEKSLEWFPMAEKSKGDRLTIRWLGVAGFELDDGETILLIDPFLSRPRMGDLLKPVKIDTASVNRLLLSKTAPDRIKAILISHNHYDHALDLPYVLARTHNPRLFGSENVRLTLENLRHAPHQFMGEHQIPAFNFTQIQCDPVHKRAMQTAPLEAFFLAQVGAFRVYAFPGDHPPYTDLGIIAFNGCPPKSGPVYATGLKTKHNTSIAYLINFKNKTLLFKESPASRLPDCVQNIDFLFQGIAARAADCRIAETIRQVQPEFVIPTHYDNFFEPFSNMVSLDTHIGGMGKDYSNFEGFLTVFRNRYPKTPKLRLFVPLKKYHILVDQGM